MQMLLIYEWSFCYLSYRQTENESSYYPTSSAFNHTIPFAEPYYINWYLHTTMRTWCLSSNMNEVCGGTRHMSYTACLEADDKWTQSPMYAWGDLASQQYSNDISHTSWGQHGAHPGDTGSRWAPWWPHEPCYLGCIRFWNKCITMFWTKSLVLVFFPRLFLWPPPPPGSNENRLLGMASIRENDICHQRLCAIIPALICDHMPSKNGRNYSSIPMILCFKNWTNIYHSHWINENNLRPVAEEEC